MTARRPATRITADDGRTYVVVRPELHPVFARACVTAWSVHDKRDRRWMLRHAAINVPVEILPAARKLLENWGETAAGAEAAALIEEEA